MNEHLQRAEPKPLFDPLSACSACWGLPIETQQSIRIGRIDWISPGPMYVLCPSEAVFTSALVPNSRIESQIAIATLLRRLPNLRIDDAEKPEWRPTFVLRGLKRLPASW